MSRLRSAHGQTTTEFVMIAGLTVVSATGMLLVMNPAVRCALQQTTECIISDTCMSTPCASVGVLNSLPRGGGGAGGNFGSAGSGPSAGSRPGGSTLVPISSEVDTCGASGSNGSVREQDLKARELADLAEDVYNPVSDETCGGNCANASKNQPGNLPGKRVAGPGQYPPDLVDARGRVISLKDAIFEDGPSGFKAALYETAPAHYVLAFAGTDGSDWSDWYNNLYQGGMGIPSDQYNEAILLASEVNYWASRQGATLELTGHSLGGGLAATAAMVGGLPATTFNMARPSKGTMELYGVEDGAAGNVEHYYVEDEILTWAQDDIGGQVGKSIGNQHTIPVVDPRLEYLYEKPEGFLGRIRAGWDNFWIGAVVSYDHHGMEYVKDGLDKQIADDPPC